MGLEFTASAHCVRVGVCSALCHLGMHADIVRAHVVWKKGTPVWRTYYRPGLALRPFEFLFFTDAFLYDVQERLMDVSGLYTT